LLEIGVSPTIALALSICIGVQRGVSRLRVLHPSAPLDLLALNVKHCTWSGAKDRAGGHGGPRKNRQRFQAGGSLGDRTEFWRPTGD